MRAVCFDMQRQEIFSVEHIRELQRTSHRDTVLLERAVRQRYCNWPAENQRRTYCLWPISSVIPGTGWYGAPAALLPRTYGCCGLPQENKSNLILMARNNPGRFSHLVNHENVTIGALPDRQAHRTKTYPVGSSVIYGYGVPAYWDGQPLWGCLHKLFSWTSWKNVNIRI